ncbi:hypothetical protein [Bermanella sp. R86510]|uniref:hypothetical protein n=1 Tax=unclassified Bermanella TaxID=2627862 RepID=UPI0037C7D31F
MKKLLIPAIAALALIGCGSDDDTNDVVETSDTVSLETAQVISESFSTVTGTVNTASSTDEDDYFEYTLAEGDIVTITGTVDSETIEGIPFLTVRDKDGEEIYVDENGEPTGNNEDVLTHFFDETAGYSVTYTYVVPASQTKMYAWMNATLLGSATYSITVQIETP